MKKVFLFISCILFVLISFGCTKSAEENQSKEETVEQIVEKTLPTKEAIALYSGTPLYIEDSEGKMVYATEVAEGDKLFVYYNGDVADSKEAIRKLNNGQEDSFKFIHVTTEYSRDQNYWTREIFVAKEHSVVGVITEDAYIYNSPQSFDVTDKTVKQGALVALKKDLDSNSPFTTVTIYNETDNGKEIYLKTELISTLASDVIAVKTMNKVKNTKNLDLVVENKLNEIFDNMDISSAVRNFLFTGDK